MKKLKITALLAVLAVSPFYAGVLPADSNPVIKVLADAIKWKSESIDVGNIPQGKPKLIRFEFTNTSKKTNCYRKCCPILRMYNGRLYQNSDSSRKKRVCRSEL